MSTPSPKNTIETALDEITAESGMAVVIVDGNTNVVALSNDNSICRTLNPPETFVGACAQDCGRAFERTREAGAPVDFECHAGLQCRSVLVSDKKLVAITGRTFTKARNYREATARAINGDWRSFPPTKFFDNVILSGSTSELDRVDRQISELSNDLFRGLAKKPEAKAKPAAEQVDFPPVNKPPDPLETSLLNYKIEPGADESGARPDPFESSMMNFGLEALPTIPHYDVTDREAWRGFIPSLLKVSYKLACRRILEFLARHYGIDSSLWLQREGGEFETGAVFGEFENKPVRIGITPDDKRIRAAVRDDSPIVLKERQAETDKKGRLIQLFPVVIGGEVRNALGVAREEMDQELSGRVLKFCRYVASRLEILRLREAVAERERLSRMMKEFNDQLRNIDADNFWERLTSISAELVGAERASLLILGPSDDLIAKATVGIRMDLAIAEDVGERVARTILEKGKPVLVIDTARAQLPPAPAERRYKTSSFISYPITLAERGIAIMNFTDKVGGERFEKRDLDLLDSIAPQVAVVVDRMTLREKAGEYAQLSITDSLTGLLNRRYIEERLTEEINRSERSGEPVTLLMLDVDEFKSYNDRYGHPAGDEALELIGQILRENLRGADVAARYGGEEFSVLLPGTNLEEAHAIAERIRRHVEDTRFPKRKVTVSIGIATLGGNLDDAKKFIKAADDSLYAAKRAGRNNIQVYTETMADGGEQVH
ncbi:MAG TPA: diguanylate cyclase [Pyrinomonadaceae bacterium]|jgi:diguanylate cyclase (GGDEF)-like protein